MHVLNSLSTPTTVAILVGFGLLTLACWFLGGVGILEISRKKGIKLAAVCFVPFLMPYGISRSAEQKTTKKGEKFVSSKMVLVLTVLEKILAVLAAGLIFFAKVSIEKGANAAIAQGASMELGEFWSVIPVIIVSFCLFAVAVANLVLYYKSLWGAFSEIDKDHALLWFLLSLIFQRRFCNVMFFFLMNKLETAEPPMFTLDET